MIRLIQKNRVLSAILAWAVIAGTWEATQVDVSEGQPDTTAQTDLLIAAYPDTPRVLFTRGALALGEGDLPAALELLGRSYDAGYKEDENVYAAYIDALVRTQSPRKRIAEVVARWRRDYPASGQLVVTRERLRNAKVLP